MDIEQICTPLDFVYVLVVARTQESLRKERPRLSFEGKQGFIVVIEANTQQKQYLFVIAGVNVNLLRQTAALSS